MRDCRGYDEAFNLAAEFLCTPSNRFQQNSHKLPGTKTEGRQRGVGGGGGAGGKAKRAAVVTRTANVLQLHERWQHPNAAWL